MDMYEKQLSRKDIYFGRIINVHVDDVQVPGGRVAVREVVEHPGGVCIAPLDAENNLYFVEQYRYAMGEKILELPAGKLEHNEPPDPAAVRELQEETGFTAEHIEKVSVTYPSVGCSTERLHLYIATGLHAGEQQPDEDEYLNLYRIPLAKAVDMVMSGEINDSKTMTLVLMVDNFVRRGRWETDAQLKTEDR